MYFLQLIEKRNKLSNLHQTISIDAKRSLRIANNQQITVQPEVWSTASTSTSPTTAAWSTASTPTPSTAAARLPPPTYSGLPIPEIATSKSQAPALVQAGPYLLRCRKHPQPPTPTCLLWASYPRECQPVKARLRPWYKLVLPAEVQKASPATYTYHSSLAGDHLFIHQVVSQSSPNSQCSWR